MPPPKKKQKTIWSKSLSALWNSACLAPPPLGVLAIPFRRSTFSQSTFAVKASHDFNKLPENMRGCGTFRSFSCNLKSRLLENLICSHWFWRGSLLYVCIFIGLFYCALPFLLLLVFSNWCVSIIQMRYNSIAWSRWFIFNVYYCIYFLCFLKDSRWKLAFLVNSGIFCALSLSNKHWIFAFMYCFIFIHIFKKNKKNSCIVRSWNLWFAFESSSILFLETKQQVDFCCINCAAISGRIRQYSDLKR